MTSAVYHLSTLPNGVRVATAEMPHMASVSAGIWAAVGSRFESDKDNGIAHFIEHLLFKGTPTRSATQIAREIERLGANVNAFTSEDHSCFYAKGPAAEFATVLEVIADMYRNSVFDPEDIENERAVIKDEIAMYRDQPSQQVEDLLSAAAWPGHPLGLPITGTEDSLDRISRNEIVEFHRLGYSGAQTVISVAGPVRHDEVLKLARGLTSGMETGRHLNPLPYPSPEVDAGRGARRVVVERDVEQVQLAFGFPAPDRRDDRRFALKVLNVLLGENMSSLLFQRIREEEGLCYTVQSDTTTFEDSGLLHIDTALDPDKLPRTLEVMEQIFASLRDETVKPALLDDAKRYLSGQTLVALENTSPQMSWAGESILAYGEIRDPEVSRRRVEAVTAGDIQRLAREIFTPGAAAVAAVGPEGTEAQLKIVSGL